MEAAGAGGAKVAGGAIEPAEDGAIAGATDAAEAGDPAEAGLALAAAGLLRGCNVMWTRPPAAAVPWISPVSVS